MSWSSNHGERWAGRRGISLASPCAYSVRHSNPAPMTCRTPPTLVAAQILHAMGAEVTVYDPATLASARRAVPELGYAAALAEAARDAHVVLLLTELAEFAELRPSDLDTVVAQRNVVDERSVLDAGLWHASGWNYRGPGLGRTPPLDMRLLRDEAPRAWGARPFSLTPIALGGTGQHYRAEPALRFADIGRGWLW